MEQVQNLEVLQEIFQTMYYMNYLLSLVLCFQPDK